MESPASLNASEGTVVQFHCSTQHSMVSLSWSGVSGLTTITNILLEGGGKRTTITFKATAERNNTVIKCTAGGVIDEKGVFDTSTAVLMVQGKESTI